MSPFILEVVFSGLIALAPHPAPLPPTATEMRVFLLNGMQASEGHHQPYLEFDCRRLVSPSDFPCEDLYREAVFSDDLGHPRFRLRLTEGYKIVLRPLYASFPSNSLDISNLTGVVDITKLQTSGEATLDPILVTPDLKELDRVVAYLDITSGRAEGMGNRGLWKFKTEAGGVYDIEPVNEVKVSVTINAPAIVVELFQYDDFTIPAYSMIFKPDDNAILPVVPIRFSNEPDPLEYCRQTFDSYFHHFHLYYEKLNPVLHTTDPPYSLTHQMDTEVACIEHWKMVKDGDTGGRPPVICMKALFQFKARQP